MALRRLVALVIFCPELWRALGEAPHPCFASEAVPTNERRFFTFAPANVRSDPAVDCVFVFGGPPGSLLRLGLYDVRTKGPQVFLGQGSARLCGRDVIRVYDVGPQGLQLKAAYCGLLRRGKMLSMSSNMAVVTYTSDNNDPGNAFNLGVDALDVVNEDARGAATLPCRDTSPATATTPVAAFPAATVDGGGVDDSEGAETNTGIRGDQYGDSDGASGDSESGEQEEAWYLDNGAVIPVTSAGGGGTKPPEPGPEGAPRVGTADRVLGRAEVEPVAAASPGARGSPPGAEELEGEETKKVVTVYSNGTGDEDEDAIAFYYYL